jgi:two-component system alkaline phosphatase synthesis response regulator PhoP
VKRRRVSSGVDDLFKGRILLAEDDAQLASVLTDTLLADGFWVTRVSDGVDAAARAAEGGFDLLLLDLTLPRQNGLEVCRQLRERGVTLPILILTGWTGTQHKVASLRLGADDYMTKPFEPAELLARIHAMIRRSRWVSVAASCHLGPIEVDLLRARVTKNQQPVDLTTKELMLLQYLFARRGCAISRNELLAEVWGYRSASTRTVDVHIATLRRKLEDNPSAPAYIVTVPRAGYMIRNDENG